MLWVGITRLRWAVLVTSTGLCCVSVAREGSPRGLCWRAAGAAGVILTRRLVYSHRRRWPSRKNRRARGLLRPQLRFDTWLPQLHSLRLKSQGQPRFKGGGRDSTPYRAGIGGLQTHSIGDGDTGRDEEKWPLLHQSPTLWLQDDFSSAPWDTNAVTPGCPWKHSRVPNRPPGCTAGRS